MKEEKTEFLHKSFPGFHIELMETRNENQSSSAIQKRSEREKLKRRNQINEPRDIILFDTFGLEEDFLKKEKKDMTLHELRDELSNQKLSNQFFLFKGKTDLDGNCVETIMPFKLFEAFEYFSEATDERYDIGSTIIREADISIDTDRKTFTRVKRSDS